MRRTLSIETIKKVEKKVLLKGWVSTIRKHGKIIFIDLRDRTGTVQVVGTSKFSNLRPECVVKILGVVKKRPQKMINSNLETGKVEVAAEKLEILSKSFPLPFDMGAQELKTDLPTLLDYRALTLRHKKIKAIFKVQETIVCAFRKTMQEHGFTEFQAPTLVATATEGGAQIFPVKYFGHEVYLAQSPQFYKQIMVSIFERVFTLSHAYRAEPSITTRHLTEYIGLDVEFGFIDSWQELMDMAEILVKRILEDVKRQNVKELALYKTKLPKVSTKIPRIKLKDAKILIYERTKRDIRKLADLDPEGEREMSRWARQEFGSDLVFITHYPTKKRPMYTFPDPEDQKVTLSFDLIGCGQEWITGGQRINDYKKLLENIKKWGYNISDFEKPYLEAFRYGMPPEGGFCLGLERITANILGLANIREASLFPRDMERVDIRLSKKKKTNKIQV